MNILLILGLLHVALAFIFMIKGSVQSGTDGVKSMLVGLWNLIIGLNLITGLWLITHS